MLILASEFNQIVTVHICFYFITLFWDQMGFWAASCFWSRSTWSTFLSIFRLSVEIAQMRKRASLCATLLLLRSSSRIWIYSLNQQQPKPLLTPRLKESPFLKYKKNVNFLVSSLLSINPLGQAESTVTSPNLLCGGPEAVWSHRFSGAWDEPT